jgi:hypothetical protein
VRGPRLILLAIARAAALSVSVPAAALASGCGGSAGDSQYVDPLQNCNPPSGGHSGGTSHTSTSGTVTSTPTTSTPPVTTPSATTATTTTAATTTPSAKDPKPGKSLPRTGLDLLPALAVAFALLGGGVALRRVTRSS